MSGSGREQASSAIWVAVGQIELPEKKYFKIGEVAHLVGVEPHVLRYWQTQFPQVRPHKSRSGHRLYRRKDVETLLAVKELLHVQRFTIAGARQALRNAVVHRGDTSIPPTDVAPTDDRRSEGLLGYVVDSRIPEPADGTWADDDEGVDEQVAAADGEGAEYGDTEPPIAADDLLRPSARAVPTLRGAAVDLNPVHLNPVDLDTTEETIAVELIGLPADELALALEGELAARAGPSVVVELVGTEPEALVDAAPVPLTAVPVAAVPVAAVSVAAVPVAAVPVAAVPVAGRPAAAPIAPSRGAGRDVEGRMGFAFVAASRAGREALLDAKNELLALLGTLDREDGERRRASSLGRH